MGSSPLAQFDRKFGLQFHALREGRLFPSAHFVASAYAQKLCSDSGALDDSFSSEDCARDRACVAVDDTPQAK